jgi:hypothetical protein
VSQRTKGSTRRQKAVAHLTRKHQTIARQRRDFHQKTALALVRIYDTIYLEDLQVRNLSPGPGTTVATGRQRRLSAQGGCHQGWSEHVYPGRRVVCFPCHPRLQSSRRWQARGSDAARVHAAGR